MKSAILSGPELVRAVMQQIINEPSSWNQKEWHCNSAHCFGGWIQILSGMKDSRRMYGTIVVLLGISYYEAIRICEPSNSLGMLTNWASWYVHGMKGDFRDWHRNDFEGQATGSGGNETHEGPSGVV